MAKKENNVKQVQKINTNSVKQLVQYILQEKKLLVVIALTILISLACYIGTAVYVGEIVNLYVLPYVGQVPKYVAGLIFGVITYIAIGLTDVTTLWLQNRMMLQVAKKVCYKIREDIFSKLQALPLRFFDANLSGQIMSRFTNDMDMIYVALEQSLAQLIGGVLVVVGVLLVMFILNWKLALISLAGIIVLSIILYILIKQSSKKFVAQQRDIANLNGYVQEMFSGEKVVKAFTYEERAGEQFRELNEKYFKSSATAQIIAGLGYPITGNLVNIMYAITIFVGGLMLISGSGLTLSVMSSFILLVRMFIRPLQQLGNQINSIFAALAGANNIFQMMDELPETNEGTITLHEVVQEDRLQNEVREWYWADESVTDFEDVPLRGDVRFHDVTFSYDGKKTILKDVSLYAKPGQKIAFVGPTGAGKTTITNLINRFYDIQEGLITYDGIDIKNMRKEDLRHSLGIVLQDTHLFTGTIMDNIRYGKLDATEKEVVEAAKCAMAHDFITRLPDGYNTMISGSDNSSLSQGQRQLLAIARAAVADPPVLILDEATSSIDTPTEKLIEKGMDKLMEGRTVFVIAHRLSTIRNANAIMVLQDGEIVERGDHDSLLADRGMYYRLYTGQYAIE